MSVKTIFGQINQLFAKIENFSGALGLLLVFALAGLTFLNNQLNFDIPAANKVRDAFNLSTPFSEVAKLEPRNGAKPLATTYTSPVPAAGYYAPASYTSYTAFAPAAATFHISEPTVVDSPAVDAGYGIMRYIDKRYGYVGKFLYAHSTLAFSPLKSLSVDNYFTATIDGITSTYRVSARYVFNKASQLDGDGENNSRRDRIYRAKDENGVPHDLSLMTCGNGYNDDRNYRLVLFADQI